jgi:hypothetical protein
MIHVGSGRDVEGIGSGRLHELALGSAGGGTGGGCVVLMPELKMPTRRAALLRQKSRGSSPASSPWRAKKMMVSPRRAEIETEAFRPGQALQIDADAFGDGFDDAPEEVGGWRRRGRRGGS